MKECSVVKLSMTDIWDDTRRFVQREHALLLPIGFASFGVAAMMMALALPERSKSGQIEAGSWMLWLIPCAALMMLGYLAISRIVLRPGISVGEALNDAMRLLPRALGLALVVTAAITLLATVASMFVAVAALALKFSQGGATMLLMLTLAPAMLWISVRLVVLWPALANDNVGIRETIKRTLALTKPYALQIVTLLVVNFAVFVMLAAVVELAAGSVILLVTRMLGVAALGSTLVALLMAAFNAIYATLWSVYLARLYSRLAGSSSGI